MTRCDYPAKQGDCQRPAGVFRHDATGRELPRCKSHSRSVIREKATELGYRWISEDREPRFDADPTTEAETRERAAESERAWLG